MSICDHAREAGLLVLADAKLVQIAGKACDLLQHLRKSPALAALEGRAAFNDVVAAYNRCAPLAVKADTVATGSATSGPAASTTGPVVDLAAVDPSLFAEPVEAELHAALAAQRDPVLEQLGHLEIDSAIMAAAQLRPVIDRYFAAVLVMSDDAAVRVNRLAQLGEITAVLRAIGDFGRLPTQDAQK